MASLHGMRQVPESRFLSLWEYYTELCTWMILFSAVTGICLWTARRSERWIGGILLGAVGGGSVSLMLYVWLGG